jgi:hypothetical protein
LWINIQLQTTAYAKSFVSGIQSTAVGTKLLFADAIVQHGLLYYNIAKVFDVVHHLQLCAFRIRQGAEAITAVDGIVGIELSAMGANFALYHLVHCYLGNACATLVTKDGRKWQHLATLGAGGHFRLVSLHTVQIGHLLTQIYGNGRRG